MKTNQQIQLHIKQMHAELVKILCLLPQEAREGRSQNDHEEMRKMVEEIEQNVNKLKLLCIWARDWSLNGETEQHPNIEDLTDTKHILALTNLLKRTERLMVERLLTARINSLTFIDELYEPERFMTIAIFKGNAQGFKDYCKWWAGAAHRPQKEKPE